MNLKPTLSVMLRTLFTVSAQGEYEGRGDAGDPAVSRRQCAWQYNPHVSIRTHVSSLDSWQ